MNGQHYGLLSGHWPEHWLAMGNPAQAWGGDQSGYDSAAWGWVPNTLFLWEVNYRYRVSSQCRL